MAKSVPLSDALRDEYNRLFTEAEIRRERRFAVEAAVDAIMAPKTMARYRTVEAATGVPAFLIGLIHKMEADLSFRGHQHNGDALTERTVHVPKGRPKSGNPPFTWEASAIDALTEKLADWTDWSLAGIAYQLEGNNGWGHRLFHPSVKSPYLWSFTTVYSAGKYIADGKWSSTAVSKQCGALAMLKVMLERQLVTLDIPVLPADEDVPAAATPHSVPLEGILDPDRTPPPYPGKALRHGSKGDDVERVQRRLLALGITVVGAPDGDFGDKTEWGVRLLQTRSEDAQGEPLEVDGVVGPRTWAALFGSLASGADAPSEAAVGLAAAALAAARGQVGVREHPLGSNRGPEVDIYLSNVAAGLLGQPWCMAFVYWCFTQAANQLGVANTAPKTASVIASWQKAQNEPKARIVTAAEARRDPAKVTPGMVFYIDTGGGSGHTGFVADVIDGRLVTIEGNTNDGGTREGIGVFIRSRRRVDTINLGFIDFG